MLAVQNSLPLTDFHLRFIVHQHQATRLHYDLRMEFGSILFNLVLPKGPSVNPRIHRLAIQTHDHAKSCLKFEGRIQSGRYGAGPLLAWDLGLYAPRCPVHLSHEEAIRRGLTRGRLGLTFKGTKLIGDWTLKRFHENWLFTKDFDGFASDEDILRFDRSVFSNRKLSDL